MIETKIELRKLTAASGMVLTNGETFSSVGGSVFLGINDKKENWQEVTEEEREKLKLKIENGIR